MTIKEEIFSTRLKELLTNKKITQKELAAYLNTTEATISRYLKGTQLPRYDMIQAICDYFSVSTDYILGNDNMVDATPKDHGQVIYVPVFKELKFSDKIDENNPNIIRWIPVAKERFENSNTLFFKEVVTDEMNPLLFKGDLVLFEIIRPGIDKIYTGDICLCTKGDNDAVIREMVNTESGYVFNLMNVNMPPRPRTLKRIKEEDINIVAKALEFVHIFPYRGPVNE